MAVCVIFYVFSTRPGRATRTDSLPIILEQNRRLHMNAETTRFRIAWNEHRLLFYSALIGIAGGVGAQIFVRLSDLSQRLFLTGFAGYQPPQPGTLNPQPVVGPWGLWLIPVATTLGGLLSGILVYTFAPEAEGHGTDAAVEAFHFKGGKVRPVVPLIKASSSAITIGSGGAAGREGPTAQISVGVGSMLAGLLRLPDEDRRILVLAGIAAGLAAIFRSPLGMAIFSVEILYAGMAFETEALIYTVIASVVAYAVNGVFVGWSPIFLFPESVHFTRPIALVGYALLGIVAGIIGAFEPPIFYGIRDLFRSLKIPDQLKPAIGGLLMGLLGVFIPEIISTGYGWVQNAMTGGYIGWSLIFLALAKIVAMSLTISSGGSGGVFGPNVYIGGMVGAWVAFVTDRLIPGAGFNPAAFAVVGMAAVFAGTARVPIATLIMVAEMTGGYGLIVPSMLATTIAFVVQRTVSLGFKYPRLYEAQVELRSDSPTHLEPMLKATFAVLEQGPLVNLRGVTLPHLASLVRHGTPIPIHNGQGQLLAVNIGAQSKMAGRTIASTFGQFPDFVAVAIIRNQQVQLPRGATLLESGDQLLVITSEISQVEVFRRLASGENP
jgi:CIC family chloride channel protein